MKIVWFCSSLEQKGGGERFALEAVAALRGLGHDTRLVCDRLSEEASFDGTYDLSDVICTESDYQYSHDREGYIRKVWSKASGSIALMRILRRERPDLVVCQSEYDTIKLYLLSRLIRFRYRTFVFGQMYQLSYNISRYSRTFRRHLETIVASRPGYRESVQMPPPKLSLLVRAVNEPISWLKYRAHHSADRIFTLSGQVAWEVSLIYARTAEVARAAFREEFIDHAALAAGKTVSAPVRFLSVSRLAQKKRIDLMIRAFSLAKVPGTLTIIGTGSEEARLHKLAAESPRSADIHFLGSVSDERLVEELGAADCLVSLDIGDYDISVVEAMGKGRRVILAKDFDLESFGPAFTGAVSAEPSPEAVAAAMDGLLEMAPPSPANLPALLDQTWESLALKVAAP